MEYLQSCLKSLGVESELPQGSFYLWVWSGQDGSWDLVERLASEVGILAAPGSFFGSSNHVRIAAVQTLEKLELIQNRLDS